MPSPKARSIIAALFLVLGCLSFSYAGSIEPDWQLITALWQNFVKDPSSSSASELTTALSFASQRTEMPDDDDFREDLFTGMPFVIAEIRNGNPWAIQLGLRLSNVSGVPYWYDLMTALSDLAETHPKILLQQMDRYYADDSVSPESMGVIWFFSTLEVKPTAVRRAEALSTVDDPSLIELRDRYVSYLNSHLEPRPESNLPDVVHRVQVDLSTFSGVVLTGSAVVARVTIAKDGSTKDVELVRGVHPDVDSAFLDALRQWRYETPLEDGKPVEVTYFQTLRINLQ